MDNSQKPNNMSQANHNKQSIPQMEQMSQVGKTPEEILPYLLSGESDDLSFDFFENS